jgi:aminoglycoside/choline kinase family phosphotransferase
VLFSLAIIAISSTAWQWKERELSREVSVGYITWEYKNMIELDDHQVSAIRTINYAFYDALSEVYEERCYDAKSLDREVDLLIDWRSQKIMAVLDPDQKKQWEKMIESTKD